MIKKEHSTLNTMLAANNISPEIAEIFLCYTLRFLQFQTICKTLRNEKMEYIRWLNLSRQMLHPTEFARKITTELCQCQLDENSYELIGKWLLAFYRKKGYRIIYPQKVRQDLLHQQKSQCAICGSMIDIKAELDHIIPWKYVGDELDNNLQLLCFQCNRSKKASPLYQLQMLLRTGKHWQAPPASA